MCVCVRCASDQLCSRREGAALLTDPFKDNMVERAVKVGQENTETLQKRLSFGVFAPNRAALLVSEVKILICGLVFTFKRP